MYNDHAVFEKNSVIFLRGDGVSVKEDLKKLVASEILQFLKDDMIIGLGSGSTMVFVINKIGEAIKGGKFKRLFGVPTSFQSEILGRENGIQIIDFNVADKIDLAIDGADEIDPEKNLIKGGGGAHTREKYIDYFAERFLVVADDSKLVNKLGQGFAVPVEVLPQAYQSVQKRLDKMNAVTKLRMAVKKAGPVITDQGNFIIDAKFEDIENPKEMEIEINNIPGTLENGIFTTRVEQVLIGNYSDGNMQVIRL